MEFYIDKVFIFLFCSFLLCRPLYSQDWQKEFIEDRGVDMSVEQKVDSLLSQADRSEEILDSVLVFYERALFLSKKYHYSEGQSIASFEMGKRLLDERQFEKGLESILNSIDMYADRNPSRDLMLRYKYAGIGYSGVGEQIKSIAHYGKALEIADQLNRLDDVARIKNNIGIVYLEQNHFEKAIEYLKSALELNTSPNFEISILGNLGLAESNRLNYDSALAYYTSALKLAESINDEPGTLFIMDMLSSLSYSKKDYSQSLEYSFELVGKYEKLDLLYDAGIIYNRIGLNYGEMGRFDEADSYYQKSLSNFKELNSKEIIWIYANIAFNEALRSNYKEAYEFLKIHLDYKDSIFSVEKNKQVEEALAKYEGEKNEKEIAVLEAQNEVHEANDITQVMIRNITLGASGIIMIVLVVFIVNYAQKLKSQEKLSEQQEVINSQRILDLLKDNEISTIKANVKGQEEERVRMARDLHDGVAGSLAAVKMKLSRNASAEDLAILDDIDQIYNEVRGLSHGLTPLKVAQEPLVSLIRDYMENLNKEGGIDFQLIVSPGLDFVELSENQKVALYRIMQELIFNVVKHARATFAELQLTKNTDMVNVILEDNGVGFDKGKRVKGIGVKNVMHRVEMLGGEMNIDSVLGRGTIVNIDFPLVNNVT
ncbi:MAG: tetratricopeptide repeat protein [Reichenbachiella sp.]